MAGCFSLVVHCDGGGHTHAGRVDEERDALFLHFSKACEAAEKFVKVELLHRAGKREVCLYHELRGSSCR